MAKIFIGIALVVTLATAVLGFLTKSNVSALKEEKVAAKTAQNKAEGALHVKEGEVKKAQEDVAAGKSTLEAKEQELASKAKEADEANKKLAETKTALDGKDGEIAALNEKLSKVPGALPAAPDDAKLAEAVKRAEAAEAGLAEANQIRETVNRKLKDAESKMAPLEQYKRHHELEVMRPGLSGRVLAVNSGWNFVVLSIGDRQGLLNNAPLLVMRGGEPIAKIRVTSIETSTSIADVVPGSVRKGVTVQPGDNVVFEGSRNQARGQAAPAPADAAAPAKAPAPALPAL